MKTIFEFQNLKRGSCEKIIKRNFRKFEFLRNLEVDIQNSTVSVDAMPPERLILMKRALSNMG